MSRDNSVLGTLCLSVIWRSVSTLDILLLKTSLCGQLVCSYVIFCEFVVGSSLFVYLLH